MARITVEDCLENVHNRFELVLLAAKRARQLVRSGAHTEFMSAKDKYTVIALREIAAGAVDSNLLQNAHLGEKEPPLKKPSLAMHDRLAGELEAVLDEPSYTPPLLGEELGARDEDQDQDEDE